MNAAEDISIMFIESEKEMSGKHVSDDVPKSYIQAIEWHTWELFHGKS